MLLGHSGSTLQDMAKVGFPDRYHSSLHVPISPYSRAPRSPPWSLPKKIKFFFPRQTARRGSFGSVVIRLCQGHLHSSSTAHPTGSGHKRTLRPDGTFSTASHFFYQPFMQRCQQWFALRLSGCQTLFCREAAYFFFYRVQLTDTFQGFFCCRCVSAYIDIMDFSAGMGPTCGFCQRPLLHVPD